MLRAVHLPPPGSPDHTREVTLAILRVQGPPHTLVKIFLTTPGRVETDRPMRAP